MPQMRDDAGTEDRDGGRGRPGNVELRDMTQRFWIGAALALPVFVLAMVHLIPRWAGVGSIVTPHAGSSLRSQRPWSGGRAGRYCIADGVPS